MEVLQYVLLGITSALLVCFITFFVLYLVGSKKNINAKKLALYEKLLYIFAINLFVFALIFSILNILLSLKIIK